MTPLAKGLITITILSVTAAAAWQLGIKNLVMGSGPVSAEDPKPKSGSGSFFGGKSGPLGGADNPLKVSIVSFHGYAPALVANGASLTTQSGSIYDSLGVNIEFVIQDDIPTLPTVFGSGAAQCAWRTSDFWAQEQPNLRNAEMDARAVMVVDNTQGADAVIARDPKIQRIEDLENHSVALLQFTPSHGMVIDAIDNSSLSARKKQTIKLVYINADEGTAGVRAALEGGQVDAAALWDPDLALAVKNVPGAHVIYSTKTATNLIYDVMVCDKKVLDDPANDATIGAFVEGWMKGVVAAKKDPDAAVDALIQTEEFFALLANDEGKPFVKRLFKDLVWTGVEDNARILGLAGGTNHYERVYRNFDGIYRAAGALANPNSPVIPPSDSFEYKYIKALLAKDSAAQEAAKAPEFTFTDVERAKATETDAIVTRPVTVNFASGSSELTKRAEKTIDEEMVPMIENLGSAYFDVAGNTDSTGARAANVKLSKDRAKAVVDYLVKQWEFPQERFTVSGNGPDKPLCDEKNPEAEGLDLEACRAANRATRLAVHSR
jgi:NitT/TauT family transport system substrate-binding protein